MAETQDSGLVGQALWELDKLCMQRRVKVGLFHRPDRQREPLLHKVNTQHSRQRKRWSAGTTFRVVGGNAFHQCRSRNHFIHLFQEYAFAGLLEVQLEVEGCLFHGLHCLKRGLLKHTAEGLMQIFLNGKFRL